MNCLRNIAVGFAIVLGIVARFATAAEPVPAAPERLPQPAAGDASLPSMPPLPTAEAGPSAGGESIHDPTSPSPRMRQLIDPAKVQGRAKAPEIPIVELKARIVGSLQPGVAVLGIDKQTYVVSKGSEFSLPDPRYGGQTIRVKEINANEVQLEIQPTNLSVKLR